ncbi:hypothetical protein FACS1894180_2500 [Bacteroidia bacterium]|nr:hypothetical protein FACS1894180_2500 [Bacteroidia bacterium]
MKKLIIFSVVALSFGMFACNKPAQKAEDVTDTIFAQSVDTAKITNKISENFTIVFDNASNTAELTFDGAKATLKGDTVASGIQFSNATFKYIEHQGEIVLTRNDTVVFEKK